MQIFFSHKNDHSFMLDLQYCYFIEKNYFRKKFKINKYSDQKKLVKLLSFTVFEFEKAIKSESSGTSQGLIIVYINQKRAISELHKIMSNKIDDTIVFPHKDQINIWYAILKGLEDSLYQEKYFNMAIEILFKYLYLVYLN